jgi:acyl-CoA synthetase (AMP-forming)/AMP-acid ligase II
MIHYERSFLPLPISSSLDDQTALIISSGSTGTPKAVIWTNRNLIAIANALQHQELDEYSRGNIVMANCFYHVCGLRTALQSISGGATLALSRNDEWRENFFKNIEKYRITSAFLVPSELYYMVKNDVIVDKYDLSSLQDIVVGGSLTETIHKAIINKFKFKNFRNG